MRCRELDVLVDDDKRPMGAPHFGQLKSPATVENILSKDVALDI